MRRAQLPSQRRCPNAGALPSIQCRRTGPMDMEADVWDPTYDSPDEDCTTPTTQFTDYTFNSPHGSERSMTSHLTGLPTPTDTCSSPGNRMKSSLSPRTPVVSKAFSPSEKDYESEASMDYDSEEEGGVEDETDCTSQSIAVATTSTFKRKFEADNSDFSYASESDDDDDFQPPSKRCRTDPSAAIHNSSARARAKKPYHPRASTSARRQGKVKKGDAFKTVPNVSARAPRTRKPYAPRASTSAPRQRKSARSGASTTSANAIETTERPGNLWPQRCPGGCNIWLRSLHDSKRHFQSAIHSPTRQFRCPAPSCNQGFSRSDSLKRHMTGGAGRLCREELGQKRMEELYPVLKKDEEGEPHNSDSE